MPTTKIDSKTGAVSFVPTEEEIKEHEKIKTINKLIERIERLEERVKELESKYES